MIERIRASVAYRAKWARLGVYYLRSLDLKSVRVGGRRAELRFPSAEREVLEYELGRILFDDCYRLSEVHGPVRNVLDIGANVGIFAITARHFFPRATIHCYEPNRALEEYLSFHCGEVGAAWFVEGVGYRAGRIHLRSGETSLHSVSESSADGESTQVTFAQAVCAVGAC